MNMTTTTNETVTGRPCSRCLSHGILITRVALSEDSDEVGEETTCGDCLGTGILMCPCERGPVTVDTVDVRTGKPYSCCGECDAEERAYQAGRAKEVA